MKPPIPPYCPSCKGPRAVPTCVMRKGESVKLVCRACVDALQADGWVWTGIGESQALKPKPQT